MTHRWRTATVDSGGEDIYYEVTGEDDARTIVLSHGAGGSHAAWFQQVPALADTGHRVVTWDCRGFGRSTYRTGTHGAAAAVADIEAVLGAIGAERIDLCGQSMGGWWVTAYTMSHPQRVRSLTLSNTVGGLWTDALEAHFLESATKPPSGSDRLGEHTALSPAFAAREPARAFLYQELNTFHTPPMGDVLKALMGARLAHADLDALGIPILMITGSADQLFPAPLIVDNAARLANATLVEIPDAGHSPYFERPDEYNDALLRFLEKVS
jgi:pimeloyl-ACP methyl ester carboxylesterase